MQNHVRLSNGPSSSYQTHNPNKHGKQGVAQHSSQYALPTCMTHTHQADPTQYSCLSLTKEVQVPGQRHPWPSVHHLADAFLLPPPFHPFVPGRCLHTAPPPEAGRTGGQKGGPPTRGWNLWPSWTPPAETSTPAVAQGWLRGLAADNTPPAGKGGTALMSGLVHVSGEWQSLTTTLLKVTVSWQYSCQFHFTM